MYILNHLTKLDVCKLSDICLQSSFLSPLKPVDTEKSFLSKTQESVVIIKTTTVNGHSFSKSLTCFSLALS